VIRTTFLLEFPGDGRNWRSLWVRKNGLVWKKLFRKKLDILWLKAYNAK
jgi:hypothetical protein